MNRRAFLRGLGGIITLAVCPSILIPKDGKSIVPARPRIPRDLLPPKGAQWFESPFVYAPYIPLYVSCQLERFPDGIYEVTRTTNTAGDYCRGDILRSKLKFTNEELRAANLPTYGNVRLTEIVRPRNPDHFRAYAKKIINPEYYATISLRKDLSNSIG